MSHNWVTGETITAAQLNVLEGTAAGAAAGVTEVRARALSPTQDTYGASTSASAAVNTAAINAAIAAGRNAGAKVIIPGGTFNYQGFALPADGQIEVEGASRGGTILVNTSTTAHSITATGAGGGSYAEQWSLRNLRLKTAGNTVTAGQRALSLTLCTRFTIENVYADYHDVGIYAGSTWRGRLSSIEMGFCSTYGFQLANVFAGSTPLTVVDGHMPSCGVGLYIEDSVNSLTWVGGDFGGCGIGAQILGNGTRDILLAGVNFESCTGTSDVQVGSSTTAPASVTLDNCRFHRPGGTPGTNAIDFQNGGPLHVNNGTYDNYVNAIKQSNVTGTLDARLGTMTGVTNPINSQALGVLPGTGHVIATPANYAQVDAGMLATRGPAFLGDGTSAGVHIYTANGYGPWSALGANNDFFFQGGGAAGSRIWMKVAGAWVSVA